MTRMGLPLRFGVAAVLLVCTTVIASVWTLVALSRLSGLVTDTVRESEAVTAVTSKLSGALEREDDAVLLVLAGDPGGSSVLSVERAVVDKAVADLFDVLGPADEQELAKPLQSELQAYRRAADAVAALGNENNAFLAVGGRLVDRGLDGGAVIGLAVSHSAGEMYGARIFQPRLINRRSRL